MTKLDRSQLYLNRVFIYQTLAQILSIYKRYENSEPSFLFLQVIHETGTFGMNTELLARMQLPLHRYPLCRVLQTTSNAIFLSDARTYGEPSSTRRRLEHDGTLSKNLERDSLLTGIFSDTGSSITVVLIRYFLISTLSLVDCL